MKMFILTLSFSMGCALISLMYKKKFMLSMFLALESILLKLLFFKYIFLLFKKTKPVTTFPLFILTLSAMEASMGLSLLTLMSRDFKKKKIKKTNMLKK